MTAGTSKKMLAMNNKSASWQIYIKSHFDCVLAIVIFTRGIVEFDQKVETKNIKIDGAKQGEYDHLYNALY